MPRRVLIGAGSIAELPAEILRLKSDRVLVVTDKYLSATEMFRKILQNLQTKAIEATVFESVQPDPTLENVEKGLELLRNRQAQTVVAIGGGSSLDCGKAICCLANNPPPLSTYAGYHKIPNPGLPMIAIPTTSGTGSEATRVAVITDSVIGVKMMILDDYLLPATSIVDYELTLTMPAALTAHMGIDTLTHAIEAYVSKEANPLTDPIALSCIRLVSKYLHRAWSDPEDREARQGMAISACQGGMAFSNSSVCLVHGMSRPVGAVFHVPHGLSNAVLLPTVTKFSVSGAVARYAEVARNMNLAEINEPDGMAASKLPNGLEDLNGKLGIPRLGALHQVDPESFEHNLGKMANDALASGSPANNPVVPSTDEIVELYRAAY
jgi:alcohol dehydrogenase class IV